MASPLSHALASLASVPGLAVHTSAAPSFVAAVTSRTFIANYDGGASEPLYPSAVLVADSTDAVSAAVSICAQTGLRVCVRSGGHNWHAIWLQGPGSVLLDVGGIDHVEFDEATGLVAVGPGATNINSHLPQGYFFPGGHCPNVPVGGFLLGGGYGIGFPKYGLSSSAIEQVTVVLSSGEIKTVCMDAKADEVDETAAALRSLVKGSYHCFPGIVTEFKLKTFPSPTCVLAPQYLFPITEWRRVLAIARGIAHRGGPDTANVEVSVVLTRAPPPVVEASGVARMVVLALMFFGDSEEHARTLLAKHTGALAGLLTLVPVESVEHCPAQHLPEIFAPFYPAKARYQVEGHAGDETLAAADDEQFEAMLDPIIALWQSDECPPPPSHTLLALSNPFSQAVLATGFRASFICMSHGIFQDPSMDAPVKALLRTAHEGLIAATGVFTHVTEGDIRDVAKPMFNASGKTTLEKCIATLDPGKVFHIASH